MPAVAEFEAIRDGEDQQQMGALSRPALTLAPPARHEEERPRVKTLYACFAFPQMNPDDALWQDMRARFRARVPAGVTPEEVEADIAAALEEVRQERRASGH